MPYGNPYGYTNQLPPIRRAQSMSGTYVGGVDPITGMPQYLGGPGGMNPNKLGPPGRTNTSGMSNVNARNSERAALARLRQRQLLELKRLSPRRYADVLQQMILGNSPQNRQANVSTAQPAPLRNPARDLLAGYLGAGQRPQLSLGPPGSGARPPQSIGGGMMSPPNWQRPGFNPAKPTQQPQQPIKRDYAPRFNWRE